jgi:hypothetical protein
MRVNLGVLRDHIGFLLAEGRVDDAREAFPDMEDEDFDYIVNNQPAGSNNKYLSWALKQASDLLENDPDRQALALVIQAVRLFDGNQQRLQQRDLNQYKTIGEVEEAVQALPQKKSKNQEQKQAKADTDSIYSDDRITVVRPNTTEASCKYGAGTKWCIAATATHNYFNSYSESNNKFYFVIDKHATSATPQSKFAIAIIAPGQGAGGRQVQVYDAADKLVSIDHVAKMVGDKWPKVWEMIQAHVAANPLSRAAEDAQKATEEHVKALLAGEKVSQKGIEKVAHDGKLTTPVVTAIIKHYKDYAGPGGNQDERSDIVTQFERRIEQMPHDAAMAAIKWAASVMGNNNSRSYQIDNMIKNANLSPADFRELTSTGSEPIMANVFANPNAPDDLKASIAKQVNDFKIESAQRIVYEKMIETGRITKEQFIMATTLHPGLIPNVLYRPDRCNLSPDLIRLIPIRDAHDLKRLTKLPNVPPDFMADMLDDKWKSLTKYDLYEVLRTAPLSPDHLEELWNGKGPDIKAALLQNPNIGVANLSKFAQSKNSAYRFAVAHNTTTSADDLASLSTDESVSTRSAVADNPKTPAEALTRLAGDEANVVRASVAGNRATPSDILKALTKDSDENVRKVARKTHKRMVTHEAFKRVMMGTLLREALEDDDDSELMTPHWTELPKGIKACDFVAVFLLQHNGHATREEITDGYQQFNPQRSSTRYKRRRVGRFRHERALVNVPAKTVWQIIKGEEGYNEPTRTTTSGGRGWWWAPPGINKGALFRLTPAGASAALEKLAHIRRSYPNTDWKPRTDMPTPKMTPPSRELSGQGAPARAPTGPRGPKVSYKVYGKMKGAPAHTRLKGQAFVAPANTQFTPGEQATLQAAGDKLKVKKVGGDHEQTWEPTDG